MQLARYRYAPHVAWQRVGGEVVVVDLRSAKAIGLNETAGRTWEAIGQQAPEAIAQLIAAEHGIEESVALDDVRRFVESVLSMGLIEPADE